MSDKPQETRHAEGKPTGAAADRTVAVDLDGDSQLPPPEGANFFHLTVSGTEAQLLVGYVSLLRVAEITTEGKPPKLPVHITHNFLLSLRGLALLKSTIDQIIERRPKLLTDAKGQE